MQRPPEAALFCLSLLSAWVPGCESAIPQATDVGARDAASVDAAGSDAGRMDGGPLDGGLLDASPIDASPIDAGSPDAGPPPCVAADDDYTPRASMSATDTWPACISDDDVYHPIGTTIGSIARVESFERIFAPSFGPGWLAWDGRDPSSTAFLDARTDYQVMNGLDSRVSFRTDEHFPRPAAGNCTMTDVVTANPDYCVGPSQLAPAILANLNAGITGDPAEPARVYAARIEALLVWFLYVSTYKESLTCTTTPNDCDSSWAYYGGGEDRSGGLGLARLIRAQDLATHDRVLDGILAVRCWRDLDPAVPATDLDLRERARAQLDRALQRGVALLFVQHLEALSATSGADRVADQLAHFAWLVALARVTGFQRMVRAADPLLADDLAAQLAAPSATAAGVDTLDLVLRLERAFPCP